MTACSYSYFSYNGVSGCAGDSCLQTTPSGMTQMIMDGQTTADLKWQRGEKYIADRWQNLTHQGSTWGGPKTYGWYSLAKAMRLAKPAAVTNLSKTSGATFDWYYGNPANATCSTEANCEKGLAPRNAIQRVAVTYGVSDVLCRFRGCFLLNMHIGRCRAVHRSFIFRPLRFRGKATIGICPFLTICRQGTSGAHSV